MSNRTLGHYRGKRWMAQAGRLYLGGALLGAGALSLAACSGGDTATGGSAGPASVAGGKTMGGQQPIKNATVTLYAAGSGGYGQGSALTPTATTDANGAWNISFACPAAGTQIYVVVSGGDAGGGTNSAIALSALLGHCGDSSNPLPTNAVIDEVTTVAAVYALNPFLSADGTQPGTSSGNATGLANAVGTLANLVDLPSGSAVSVSGGTLPSGASGTSPASALNTLADILAACVNSSGASSSQCSTLFSNALSGSTAPTTTLQAALNIARNPGANVANLYALSSTTSPFQPILTAAPGDFTLALTYSGGNLNTVHGLALDSSGNVWVANNASASTLNSGHGSIVELSPQGVQAPTAFTDNNQVYQPAEIAIDLNGNVWAANQRSASTVNSGVGSISGLNSSGGSLSGSPFVAGGSMAVNWPKVVTTDASGNVWIGNSASTSGSDNVVRLSPSSSYAGTVFSGLVNAAWSGVAIDLGGNIWLSNSISSVLELSAANPSVQVTGSPYTGAGLASPTGVAIDASGNVWVPNNATGGNSNGVTELVKSGSSYTATNISSSAEYGPGAYGAIAIDGAGQVWIGNSSSTGVKGVVVLSNNGTAVTGSAGSYAGAGAVTATIQSLALDASGDVWLGIGSSLVELVGAASPVKTPLTGPAQLP